MENENLENNDVTPASDEGKTPEPSHTKPERTEKEKAEYSLKMNARRLQELGGDPAEIIRPQIKIDDTLPDDTPLTVGTFKELQRKDGQRTALEMADSIEDEDERRAVREALEKRINPSGNAQDDFNFVRSAINSQRTSQIADDLRRHIDAKRNAAGGSASAKSEEEFTPTEQETIFMRPPYRMTKEKILEARKKAQKE